MNPTAMQNESIRHSPGRWSIVIPVYNEENFLFATLDSILAQTVNDAVIIIVDNGSTDQTPALIEQFVSEHPDRKIVALSDPRPGKVNAVETGIAAVNTEFVAMCDADTIYPPGYLEQAEAMLGDPADGIAAALAFGVYSDAGPFRAWFTRYKGVGAAAVMPRQAHTGGYGQSFRVDALKKSGGYSSALWPFMVADHEIINRILKYGSLAYSRNHWCLTSARRTDRSRVDWTLTERLLYHVTPHGKKDWLFYDYLRPRFEKRKMLNANLRQRGWEQNPS